MDRTTNSRGVALADRSRAEVGDSRPPSRFALRRDSLRVDGARRLAESRKQHWNLGIEPQLEAGSYFASPASSLFALSIIINAPAAADAAFNVAAESFVRAPS